MLTRILFSILGLISGLLATCEAPAAVFVLSNGGQLEGKLLNPEQKPRETYVVETLTGGQVTLEKAQVERVEEKSEALLWYESALPQVPNTVAGQLAMADKCKERGLKAQRDFHLQRVLDLDPNHKDARYGLGYGRVDGRWVKQDEWMASQGYVKYRGNWRIAQDLALEEAAEREDKLVKDWRQKLKMWCGWFSKGRGGNEQTARENIGDIRDVRAAPALADVVNDEKNSTELRKLCVGVLGRLQTSVGVNTFIKRAMFDSDADIRDACLEQLTKFGTTQAVREFEKSLRSPENAKVNRAGSCLAVLRDPEATLPLINALVTEHKFLVSQGNPGQMSLGFGSGPGGGGNTFSAGGRPQLVRKEYQNEQVLNALIATHPGVNFRFNVERWRRWYVERKTPAAVNLRRSD